MSDEVFKYFKEKYEKWHIKVIDIPDFKTKEEVDKFFTAVEKCFEKVREEKKEVKP